MKKAVTIGLFLLLVYHTLAHVLVCVSAWWQAEHDLTERLHVFRSVDSIVEFQIPLTGTSDATNLLSTTTDGFSYHGHYYMVVSMDLKGDTLHIAGLESQNRSFWQSDLLAFMNKHLATSNDSNQHTNKLLKFLLKEYSPSPPLSFAFLLPGWQPIVRIPEQLFVIATRALSVYAPPPETR